MRITFSALVALTMFGPPMGCAIHAERVAPSSTETIDEVTHNFHSAQRWFGMVADLAIARDADGALTPRFETLRSPLVLRHDPAGQTLAPTLPARADGVHTIALSSVSGVWIRTQEDGAQAVPAQIERGVVVYPQAIDGADLLYKLTPTHVDEYLYVRTPRDTLDRRVRVERGPGVSSLRTTSDTIEVIDPQGNARLRMGAPFARAVDGTRRRGSFRIEGDDIVLEMDLRGLAFPILIDPDWSTTGTMTIGHWSDTAWRMSDGRVMAIGGCALSGCPSSFVQSGCGQVLADTEAWSPTTGTWTTTPPLATARYAFAGATLAGGDYLVVGGCTTTSCVTTTDRAERFDVASRTWMPAGQLAVARANLTATPLNDGTVLVAGGCDTSSCTTDVERYDPVSNTFRSAAPLPAARGYSTATALTDGRVLVIGGCADAHCATLLDDAVLYDPTSDSWTSAGTMSAARAAHSATRMWDGTVLVVGGCGDTSCMRTLPSTEIWSAQSGGGGSFTSAATIPGARHNHTATLLSSGNVLVAGGIAGAMSSLPTALVYVPGSGQWVPIDAMQLDRGYHVAIALETGDVLMAGGCNPQTCMPWAEVYSQANLPAEIADAGATPDDGASSVDAESGVDAAPIPDVAPMEDTAAVDAPPPVIPPPVSPHPASVRTGALHCANDSVQELDCPLDTHPLQDSDFQPNARTYSPQSAGELEDTTTALIWPTDDDGMGYTAADAIAHCASFATASSPAGTWRLPSVLELATLVHYGRNLPSIDPHFANTQPTNYWTSTPVASGSVQTWTVKFDFGEVVPFGNTHLAAVRCVRGGAPTPDVPPGVLRQAGPLVAGNGVIDDATNGLEWQRDDDGVRRSWRDSLLHCATLSLAGRTGWHLPNISELRSIVEYGGSANGVVIDPLFTTARGDMYWTSSPNDGAPTLSWGISFNLGVVDGVTVTGLAYSRCVRHLEPAPAMNAHGGCQCATRGTPRGVPGATIVAGAAIAAWFARRRVRSRRAASR